MKPFVKTEEEGIYRDPQTMALIVKREDKYRELVKKIKELERKLEKLESFLKDKYHIWQE